MATFNRTKFVITLGPSSSSEERIAALIEAGVDVFRINMSHARLDSARELIDRVRLVSDRLGNSKIAVLVDTRGPDLRVSAVDGTFDLVAGTTVRLRAGTEITNSEVIYVEHEDLPSRLAPGNLVYIDDGLIGLTVLSATPDEALCRVDRGGPVSSRRGVNIPGVRVFPPGVSAEDDGALRMAAEAKAEFVAASMIQCADDVRRIRAVLDTASKETQIIAKIETQDAVSALAEILAVSDGLMVARGDLGVEIPPEEVPLIQKRIVIDCNRAGKPVIVATQMLESMIQSPMPTRAETNDVANAILDGTDAVMLSGETAKGRYPLEAVATLGRIADYVEGHADLFRRGLFEEQTATGAEFIAKAACRATEEIAVDYIVALTSTGRTARLIARYRPRRAILASTPSVIVARQLALSYGVLPFVVPRAADPSVTIVRTLQALMSDGPLRPEHRVAVVFSAPMSGPAGTNFFGVDTVARILEGLRSREIASGGGAP